jgi:REP element-mobilizing transposase RayT
MHRPSRSKRDHLRLLVAAKQQWNEPVSKVNALKGFRGWHQRGYLPHCDKPGLVQFLTFRVWDSMPATRRGEWEHLLNTSSRNPAYGALRSEADDQRRRELENYLDRGMGECSLRRANIAVLVEKAILYDNERKFRLFAWVVMPNHVHVLVEVGETPLTKLVQNWKSLVAVEANRLLGRTGRFWQPDYWDRFIRDTEQILKAIRYIENNPVKAKLCRSAEAWSFSSARFRDPKTSGLKLPRDNRSAEHCSA